MRPLFFLPALAAVLAFTGSANAAWNNVFQVCCAHCGGSSAPPVVVGYADPGCAPACAPACPQTSCTTRYVQRSYYQPVTTYKATTVTEPVTTMRTSYYMEPVTSYRYSCYYDPCTCSYQSVATPVTSYRMRSRCCPVTTYLQRTCMTPVTSYQQAFYYEPVTTCCTTTSGSPVMTPPAGADIRPSDPLPTAPPGGVMPGTTPGKAGVTEIRDPASPDMMKEADGTSIRSEGRRGPVRKPAANPAYTASRRSVNVEGKIVDTDRLPQAGVKVLMVNVETKTEQRTVTADRDGKFSAALASGAWLVYTYDVHDKPLFARRIEVPGDRAVAMTLTQR
jgi:hypothetical protein